MLPSQFMQRSQQMTPAPRPFEFDLQLWLGPVLVPSVAIERALRIGSRADRTAPEAAPKPPKVQTGLIATWRRRIHYRRELARLLTDCPHMIEDIGLAFEAAEAEIARPFWRATRFDAATLKPGGRARFAPMPRLVG